MSLRDAPVFASSSAMYASSLLSSRPNGAGNSIGGPASMVTFPLMTALPGRPRAVALRAMAHLTPHSNSAV